MVLGKMSGYFSLHQWKGEGIDDCVNPRTGVSQFFLVLLDLTLGVGPRSKTLG
jgi:hypothetical protein